MKAAPLSVDAYRAYGDVVAVRDDIKPRSANLGTALRYDYVAKLDSLRPGATANLCVFHCTPMIAATETKFSVSLLERHAQSTQAFVPMAGVGRYLVVVALGGDRPDLSTLRAFMANGAQGITYHPGTWHHPLVAMDRPASFACLVWEDGSDEDCDVVKLAAAVDVAIEGVR